ncbi:glycosyltransferase [Demequina muriae]|uniref:Glycosyltransferase n=1 Tax=Demequina muriae TaxID=3051664 RepID=A0ABT8GJZ6_9MICO|nr:glycosyltransferase [Demequina sp. EGI L300058]MDN4481745.1 glycosyltransferase [Demequina sp. EGI L300058]
MTAGARISVIIPAYNAESTLDAQLSALAPQCREVGAEVLIADNGSIDGTAALARSWQTRLPRLRVIDASARRGPAAARNIGAAQATARALAFCDADDVVGPGWLSALVHALDHHDAVAGALDFAALNTRSGGMGAAAGFPLSYLPGMRGAGSGNLAVTAAAFAEVRGFDEELRVGEDIDLCCRLQLAGYALHPCDEAVVHVRLRGGVVSAYRHAFAFGAADRQLRHRYAPIASAIDAGEWQPPVSPAIDMTDAGPADRETTPDAGDGVAAGRRWPRVLTPRRVDPTAFARRIGRRAGERIGRIDRTLPQVAPPP